MPTWFKRPFISNQKITDHPPLHNPSQGRPGLHAPQKTRPPPYPPQHTCHCCYCHTIIISCSPMDECPLGIHQIKLVIKPRKFHFFCTNFVKCFHSVKSSVQCSPWPSLGNGSCVRQHTDRPVNHGNNNDWHLIITTVTIARISMMVKVATWQPWQDLPQEPLLAADSWCQPGFFASAWCQTWSLIKMAKMTKVIKMIELMNMPWIQSDTNLQTGSTASSLL